MTVRVTLSVVEGPSAQAKYVFSDRSTNVLGRASDCHVRIPGDLPAASQVSRHHCLLDVNPPNVRVRDFGSLNGTRVNDVIIGRRLHGETPEEGARTRHPEKDLYHGDHIKLGSTTFRIGVHRDADDPEIGLTVIQCSKCGRSISGDAVRDHGNMVCSVCQEDLAACVSDILRKAADGEPELAPIRGYEIVKELGRGGQGIVFLARHRGSNDLVALKVLLAKVASSPDARRRFLREMHGAAALNHSNVVAFRESGEYGGQYFFTSEYCAGGSLADLVAKRRRLLPLESAVGFTLQILAGLEYAHQATISVQGLPTVRGLVHRDIKPANILLTHDAVGGTVKLGDFGLAKAFDLAGLSGYTLTGEAAGTMSFMSRVQLLDYKYASPAIDVWAVAASLYWMLTGHSPRTFVPGEDVVKTVLETAAVPIRERDPGIPAALALAIDKALVDNPGLQVHSAAAFTRDIRNALDQ